MLTSHCHRHFGPDSYPKRGRGLESAQIPQIPGSVFVNGIKISAEFGKIGSELHPKSLRKRHTRDLGWQTRLSLLALRPGPP